MASPPPPAQYGSWPIHTLLKPVSSCPCLNRQTRAHTKKCKTRILSEKKNNNNKTKHVADISIFTLANITPQNVARKKQIVVVVEISNGNQKRASFFCWCVKIAMYAHRRSLQNFWKGKTKYKKTIYHCLYILIL